MSRSYLMWTVVAFLGASIVSGTLLRETENSDPLVRYGLQLLAFLVLVVVCVLVVRRVGGGDDPDR